MRSRPAAIHVESANRVRQKKTNNNKKTREGQAKGLVWLNKVTINCAYSLIISIQNNFQQSEIQNVPSLVWIFLKLAIHSREVEYGRWGQSPLENPSFLIKINNLIFLNLIIHFKITLTVRVLGAIKRP